MFFKEPTIGKLRSLITIQQFVASGPASAYGETTGAWLTLAKAWARVLPSTGAEPIVNEGPKAKVDYEVTIRFSDAVSSSNRIVWKNRPLSIAAAVDPTQRREWLVLLCADSGEIS